MTAAAEWVLRVTSGPAVGAVVPLQTGQTVLGRVVRPGELHLIDDSISRRHAVVTVSGDRLVVADAGSTNGTSVNGRAISEAMPLHAGDAIAIGETELVVESVASRDASASVPESDVDEPAVRTIMFTDLVGSTALAHDRGDDTAVSILGVHDRITRAAIGRHRGREVKHTGDGIMAAFPSAAGGVQAAIEIMQAVDEHNAEHPALEFRLRIGLNAGEPLSSHGDLYGIAVSLAARLCDAAEPSTILASDAVRVLCLGKGKRFVEREAQTFKGIDTPVTVCEVAWDDE